MHHRRSKCISFTSVALVAIAVVQIPDGWRVQWSYGAVIFEQQMVCDHTSIRSWPRTATECILRTRQGIICGSTACTQDFMPSGESGKFRPEPVAKPTVGDGANGTVNRPHAVTGGWR